MLPETFDPVLERELLAINEGGLGAERTIMEILRSNSELCANPELVTSSLVTRFADMLEADANISLSPILEFFLIICEHAHRANQILAIESLLGKTKSGGWVRPNIVRCIEALAKDHEDDTTLDQPVCLLSLLASTMRGKHNLAATRLLHAGFSIERVCSICAVRLNTILGEPQADGSEATLALAILDGDGPRSEIKSLEKYCEIFSLQLQVLAVNPSLFDKPDLVSKVHQSPRTCDLIRIMCLTVGHAASTRARSQNLGSRRRSRAPRVTQQARTYRNRSRITSLEGCKRSADV